MYIASMVRKQTGFSLNRMRVYKYIMYCEVCLASLKTVGDNCGILFERSFDWSV
jgi:hypothetical protein